MCQLIDETADFFWIRVAIHCDLNVDCSQISKMIEFAKKKNPPITNFNLTCPRLISKKSVEEQQKNIDLMNQQNAITNSLIYFTVCVRYLNILSLNCLNLFANTCENLYIEAFIKCRQKNDSEILPSSKLQRQYNEKILLPFKSLKKLDLNCLLLFPFIDSNNFYFDKYNIWYKCAEKSLYFREPNLLFSSEYLTEIKISYYADSIKQLCNCLSLAVNLKHLNFKNCDPINDLNNENEEKV